MNTLYKSFQMPKEFMDAVEVIMKYCQNEDCQEDCKNCPCTLAEIRCGDTEEEQEPTGHWIIKDNMFWVCSECGCQTRMMKKYNTPNYCPACGVRMVEPQEGADE